MKDRIFITEAQWLELADRIRACDSWQAVQSMMAESWRILQLQQEQVIEYLGSNNVLIVEMK